MRGLNAFYGDTQVLHGLDFDVAEGGITTLLGANGAGKTSTLRALSGMIRATGEIVFSGLSICGRAPRRSPGSASRMSRKGAARSAA